MMRAPIAAISKMGKAGGEAKGGEGREGWVMATRQVTCGRLESGPKETHMYVIYI